MEPAQSTIYVLTERRNPTPQIFAHKIGTSEFHSLCANRNSGTLLHKYLPTKLEPAHSTLPHVLNGTQERNSGVTDDPYSRYELELGSFLAHKLEPDLLISKHCYGSGSGVLMTSGPWIRIFRIPDPTHIL